ncbi:MAG: rod shape-determining protein MreC [Chloroflexota bacterium]
MLTDRALRRQLVTFSLLIATCMLLLAFSDTKPIQDMRGGINFALAPIRDTLTGGARAVGSLFTSLAELDQLRRENEALRDRVQAVEEANLQIPVLQTENAKLADTLKIKRSLDHRTVAAEVIYNDPSSLERLITIAKGTDDGLFLGATVLSAGGSLVGTITEVGGNWATVRLINDTRSVVVGRDVRSGAIGEVHGNLSAPLELQNVLFNESLRVGDLVTTAGIRLSREARSQFPRDLVIGSIVSVDRDPALTTISALIQPAADLDNLELVLVVTDFQPDPLPGVTATPTPEPTVEPTDEPEPTTEPTRKPRKTQRPDG